MAAECYFSMCPRHSCDTSGEGTWKTSAKTRLGRSFMATSEQLVRVCDHFEIADDSNSEVPEWPVQDEGARWHHEAFQGQRVAYDRAHVHFGIQVVPCAEPEDMDDIPSDVYFANEKWWRAV